MINNLDKYLVEFENNFERRGGKVIWALGEKEAQKEILQNFKKAKAQVIVKQKSMTSEEIELNEGTRKKTNAKYLRLTSGSSSSRSPVKSPTTLSTPAMHKSKERRCPAFS